MGIFNFGRKDPKEQATKEQATKDTPAGAPGAADGAEKPRGLLDRLKAGLAKTAQVLRTDVRDLFKREGRLVDEDFLEELRGILVRTDMGPAAAEAMALALTVAPRDGALRLLVDRAVLPQTLAVLHTRAEPLGITLELIEAEAWAAQVASGALAADQVLPADAAS
jgi:hypothetical protein